MNFWVKEQEVHLQLSKGIAQPQSVYDVAHRSSILPHILLNKKNWSRTTSGQHVLHLVRRVYLQWHAYLMNSFSSNVVYQNVSFLGINDFTLSSVFQSSTFQEHFSLLS